MLKVLLAPPKGEYELNAYISWLEHHGFEPIVLENRVQHINMPLILCGGADIGKNQHRDSLEFAWIESALIHKQPIIGICRGMQILNAYFGGVVENIPELLEEGHRSDVFEDDEDHGHRISQYHDVVDSYGNIMQVNSRHHQYCSTITDNFKVTHVSSSDLIPEAVEDINNRIWAVQWHPERFELTNNMFPLDKLK